MPSSDLFYGIPLSEPKADPFLFLSIALILLVIMQGMISVVHLLIQNKYKLQKLLLNSSLQIEVSDVKPWKSMLRSKLISHHHVASTFVEYYRFLRRTEEVDLPLISKSFIKANKHARV